MIVTLLTYKSGWLQFGKNGLMTSGNADLSFQTSCLHFRTSYTTIMVSGNGTGI